jgi:hypothetical protein
MTTMPCLLLVKDALGRLPTAHDLRRCGFRVSAAALPEQAKEEGGEALARAAEKSAPYGVPDMASGLALLPGQLPLAALPGEASGDDVA